MVLKQDKCASALILAAGTASRMGKTKQVLPLGDKPMLQHVIDKTSKLEDLASMLIVLGHDAENIKKKIDLHDARMSWHWHDCFREGQGSSLKAGMKELLRQTKHVMVFLGDMPFIRTETIQLIYNTGISWQEPGEEPYTVRPTYEGAIGHPVFFGNLRPELLNTVHGDEGGKALVKQLAFQKDLAVEDSGVIWDLDTFGAYESAANHWGKQERSLF